MRRRQGDRLATEKDSRAGARPRPILLPAHLFKLRRFGKLVVNGPVLGEGHVRGVGILVADSLEGAQAYTAADPMVAAGFLAAEVLPWTGLPGQGCPQAFLGV